MVRRLKENKVTGILTALLVGIVMFVGMGTMKVNATEYRSETIDPTTLQVGDTVYVGAELSPDKQIVVCKQCHMIWITYGGSSQYGIGDRINSIVMRSDAHKDHAGYVGYSEFNFYFTGEYLPSNTPYTVMGNSNLGYTIKYNTNGGSAIADAVKQTHIPSIFPTTTRIGYMLEGWYTDEECTQAAQRELSIFEDITLYAKWIEIGAHEHTFSDNWSSNAYGHWHAATCEHSNLEENYQKHSYGTTGEDRYTCLICKYVDADKKAAAEVVDASKIVLKADEVQVGDKIYFGNQLSPNKWITVCKKCHMIWITSADSDPDDISVGIGVGSQKCYEVEQTDEHKDHKDDVGYADFNWYTTNSNSPLERNVPYTVIENDNLGYKITYNTNGGSEVTEAVHQKKLPDVLPTTSKAEYEFAGWYTDEALTKAAVPGKALTGNTILYAKWTVKQSTPSDPEPSKPVVKAKRTKVNDQALSSKFSITTGKTIKVTWGKVAKADGYDVYMAYCKKGKYTVVKSVKAAKTLSVTINKLNKKAVNQKDNVKCYVVAYKKVDGKKVTIGKSITGHAVGKKNTTVTDVKKIQIKKSAYSLKKGKTAKIKATIVKKNNKLPLFGHTAKFRYDTSNKKVATVSKDGKITAKGKGTCYVYIYAVNGCAKKVKVTVK
ncbi:InlB B-repeat-containing protein [Clostridium sp. L2-50]|uniref:InlB B-repeat-containing protein n=1 Tax=Clostridium sp. L2-50 TaxID=411489 RepID=UPI00015BD766|nr:InlB B-repeat-containing protein [Clostridium sp. L2-50]EDO56598.1 repeat protein [Clostridium sp. L2-50]UEA75343.1 InlB B-repeat-containing protein [Lachnospiraceae bacterium GAM79]UEA76076.1 InlB B-repeat-containing protein [Lachnospiraceae bacterium GAM79]